MLHFPLPEQYKAEPPRTVFLVTIAPTGNVLARVQLPAEQIATIEEVKKQTRLKWESLPLDQSLAGTEVRAISDAGEEEVLFAYTLAEFAHELFRGEPFIHGEHMSRAECLLREHQRGYF
jgi:hypothetical protein